MRVLIVSDSPWRKDNSFGNTYSNRFSRIPEIEIAHVYTLAGKPDFESNVKAYYQISESWVLKSVFNRKVPSVGRTVSISDEEQSGVDKVTSHSGYKKLLDFGKRHHWKSMFIGREIAWKMGNINWDGLLAFAKEFKPDLIFLPIFYTYYTNRIGLFLKRELGVPMVLEISMDYYTFKRYSLNPLFWIDRIFKRRMIRGLVKESSLMYVISDKLKKEYECFFDIPIKVLYKVPDPSRKTTIYSPSNSNSLRFLFTGNIYANRWKSLSLLVQELSNNQIGRLDIYTATSITENISRTLNVEGVSEIHPPISQQDVLALQDQADVLVHVESFDRKNRSLVRYAISTKVMDYLNAKRCILAIGPSDVASIEYLRDNDIALVADSKSALGTIIHAISKDYSIISKYAARSCRYVSDELNPDLINNGLLNDLKALI